MTAAVIPAADAHAAPAHCPNCDTALNGHFCSHCGQEAILHHASVAEFLHEFVGHYVALEGKLWGTVLRLLFRPGALTLEYIRGRRVRFVQPLRLYLTLSLLFFALLKFTAAFEPSLTETEAPAKAVASPTQKAVTSAASAAAHVKPASAPDAEPEDEADAEPKSGPESAANAASKDAPRTDISLTTGDESVQRWLEGWPKVRHQLEAFEHLTSEQKIKVFKEGFYHYAPYAIFALMPVFALYLKLLYLGSERRFGDHLLFALHTNAFAYFIFILMLLMSWGLVQFVLWCWLLGYLPWAMRRVYNSSRWSTALRWLTLMFFYSLSVGLAVGISMLAGIMTIGH